MLRVSARGHRESTVTVRWFLYRVTYLMVMRMSDFFSIWLFQSLVTLKYGIFFFEIYFGNIIEMIWPSAKSSLIKIISITDTFFIFFKIEVTRFKCETTCDFRCASAGRMFWVEVSLTLLYFSDRESIVIVKKKSMLRSWRIFTFRGPRSPKNVFFFL